MNKLISGIIYLLIPIYIVFWLGLQVAEISTEWLIENIQNIVFTIVVLTTLGFGVGVVVAGSYLFYIGLIRCTQ